MLTKFLNRWLPSSRIEQDVLSRDPNARYSPILLNELKVTPLMKREIMRKRRAQELTFRDDQRLTVLIPYRDRAEHLNALLPMLKKVLEQQVPQHQILVVEQTEGKPFNRGKLFNAGVDYIKDESDYFITHDVDMLPIDANYRCPSVPLRLVKKFEATWRPHEVMKSTYFGGVVAINKDDYIKANGYGNEFWGWGKEDDEFFLRMVLQGIVPYEDIQGLYREFENPEHQYQETTLSAHAKANKKVRKQLLRGMRNIEEDGLNTVQYNLVSVDKFDDYRKITVEV